MSRSSERVVELHGTRFSWSRASSPVVAIDAIDIARGERIFLRGPSGSGKSTLLGLVAGVLVPQQGVVSVLRRDLSTMSGAARDRFRADHIGYIFQMFNLIPYLSVIENVCLPCGFSERRRAYAVRHAGRVESEALLLLEALDLGDKALLRRPVTELSVGQQQRVAAARALIGSPELVIADEPTSALDADRRAAFLDVLFRQCDREGATLLFASHDASLASMFDRAIDIGADAHASSPTIVAPTMDETSA